MCIINIISYIGLLSIVVMVQMKGDYIYRLHLACLTTYTLNEFFIL